MAEPYAVIPLPPLSKVIAARMTESTPTMLHFRLTADVDVDVLDLRKEPDGEFPNACDGPSAR